MNAALATADLTDGIRVNFTDGNCVSSVTTSRGENIPSKVSKKSEKYMQEGMREILRIIDQKITEIIPECDQKKEIEEDLISDPPWYKANPYSGSFYNLKDLTYHLLPYRGNTLLKPFYQIFPKPPPELELLESVLNETCEKGASCAYRYFFPSVGMAGPKLLGEVAISVLTDAVNLCSFSYESSMLILETLISNLTDSKNDFPSKRESEGKRKPKQTFCVKRCVCCVWCQQTENFIDKKTEVAYSKGYDNAMKATLFIGITKYKGMVRPEIDYLQSSVQLHQSENFYLANSNPFCDYSISFDDKSLEWMVKRHIVNDLNETDNLISSIV